MVLERRRINTEIIGIDGRRIPTSQPRYSIY